MLRFSKYISLFLILIMTTTSCSAKNHIGLKAKNYVISTGLDYDSNILSQIAFKQLQQHTDQKDIISLINEIELKDNGQKFIQFIVESDAKDDYCIVHDADKLSITVRKKEDGIWLINQLVEEIAKVDDRFNTLDLPPSTINFRTKCNSFDFSYRDPHFINNLIPGNSLVLGNNNVDLDWGIWGHNLKKIVGNEADTTIYALVNNKRTKDQLSFSSTALFDLLTEYILDNFGNGAEKAYHFMIMPRDNNLVCMCDGCKELGNTKTNATPAVSHFIQKMSSRFPKHHFFTSSYNSTTVIPKEKLNKNTGVFLSTILLDKGVELNLNQPKTAEFVKEIKAWSEITPNIYIWDYAANFDDYLSPIPVLYSLQKQLKFYKNQGVKGVFINASGYDYSSFGDLKSFVAGALLKNTEKDIDELCAVFFKKYYPKNHQLLTDYYLTLEKDFAPKNKTYNLYGGFNEIVNSYLNPEQFIAFYNAIEKTIYNSSGEEKERLLKLYTALAYTKLQIAYNKVTGENGCGEIIGKELVIKPSMNQIVEKLAQSSNYSNLNSYKEANGDLNNYIITWINEMLNKKFENLLLNEPIKIISATDEGFKNPKYLNDGLPGFSNDYHQGWHISSEDLKIQFSTEKLKGTKEMKFRFLNNKRHGFYPPEKIEIWADKKHIATLNNFENTSVLESVEFSVNLDLTNFKNIELIFSRKPLNNSKIAIDEIRVLN